MEYPRKRVSAGKVIFIVAIILIGLTAGLYFSTNPSELGHCEKKEDCITYQSYSGGKYVCANSDFQEDSLKNKLLRFRYLNKNGVKFKPDCVCENNFCTAE